MNTPDNTSVDPLAQSDHEDRTWIEAAQGGDREAFGKLVQKYLRRAQAIAWKYCVNAEKARDLSQDAFIKAFRALDVFDVERPFYPWFRRILVNHCLNAKKKDNLRAAVSLNTFDGENKYEVADTGPGTTAPLEQAETQALVHAALDALDEDHRQVLMMKHFEDLSYKEIAQAMEIPIGTVMSRLFNARKKMAHLLAGKVNF